MDYLLNFMVMKVHIILIDVTSPITYIETSVSDKLINISIMTIFKFALAKIRGFTQGYAFLCHRILFFSTYK